MQCSAKRTLLLLVILFVTLSAVAQNPVPPGFQSISASWKGSPITTDCGGFTDAFGKIWTDPFFDDTTWSSITPPDAGSFNTPGLNPSDRFYRGNFSLQSTAQPVFLFFVSDDGIEIFINGQPLTPRSSFSPQSTNVCHQLGCVNIPGCGPGFDLDPGVVQIPPALLQSGTNLIAAHVSNGGGGSYFDTAVLTSSTPGSTINFVSDTTWDVFTAFPHAGSVPLGKAVDLCGVFWSCGGFPATIPEATPIWAPVAITDLADLAQFYFAKTITIPGTPLGGTVSVAADDLAEVFINGVSAGPPHGSLTDPALSGLTQAQTYDVSTFLHQGDNQVVIRGQNGPNFFGGCTGPCTYAQNPASVIFKGSFVYLVQDFTGTISVSTNNAAATFTISNNTGVTFSGSGLSLTKAAPPGTYTITFGSVPGFVTPSPLTGTLDAGATLSFTGDYVPLATLTAKPTSLSFTQQSGSGGEVQHLVLITSSVPSVPITVTFDSSAPSGWLSAAAVDVRTPMLVDVRVAPGLPPGVYTAQVTVSSPLAFDITIPVTLTVGAGPQAQLVFPVRTDQVFCSGTCTPFTANMAAIFDHDMQTAYESAQEKDINGNCVPKQTIPAGWGKIIDFEGEQADQPDESSEPINTGVCKTLHGYQNTAGNSFLTNLNYKGNPSTTLYYDAHPGYDYPFSYSTPAASIDDLTAVYPAVSGCVSYSLDAAGAPASNFHVMAIIPLSTPPKNGHCTAPVVSETGYVVFYLHLSSYLKGNDPVVCLSPNHGQSTCQKKMEVKCPTCPKEGDWVSVDSPSPIAYVGNFANGIWGGVGPHLHLEIDRVNGTARTPLDPYGWWLAKPDPYSPFGDIVNTWLWK